MTDYVIETHELTKFYGELNVVHRLNLKIPQGGIFGFLGPNGAGKSTTIKMITGLIKSSSGTIKIFGQEARQHRKIFHRIGYLPEHPAAYAGMTAYSFLQYMGRLHGISKNFIQHRILETLDFVDLGRMAYHDADKLSAGQKQRLGLAAALIHDPDLLILDEPSANLDPLSRFQLFNQLKKMVKESNKEKTVVISSHILPEVERLADHFAIINQGSLVMEGEIKTLGLQLSNIELLLAVSPAKAIYQALEAKPYVDEIILLNDSEIRLILKTDQEEQFQIELPDLLKQQNAKIISLKTAQAPIERAFLQALQSKVDMRN
ncbi:MAG: putative ABC transporter ATP-binding protein YxlF [Candidatus Heimdallarchaeota archaeon LC_3]|nr:MAG: putative ABC transporter ATP-binding protein YxlF [Candidatus Heimdallarchaeota archaeon LC_3]